ncbi:unnamed protein product [Linum trigynum]|uniref:Uncharacterized protein n=1 Tax=Linum trigynum TaxID=586398 RepID=A0AAV2D7E9_9ROSI
MPARFHRVIIGQVGPTMRSRTIEMTSSTPSPPQQPAQMPTEEPPLPDSPPVVPASPSSADELRARIVILEAVDAEKDKKIKELNQRLDERLDTSSSTPPSKEFVPRFFFLFFSFLFFSFLFFVNTSRSE